MKKKINHIEEHRKAFEIEVAAVEMNKRKDGLFEKLGRSASVPGFRAGKAPRDLLEKHYGERVTKEAVEDLISDSYQKALEEEKFIPLGYPDISDVKLDEKGNLSFKAEFNLRPKVPLKEYKGLKLKKKSVEVKDEDVEKSVKTLQESNAKYNAANDRPVRIGDHIVCDSEILIDQKPIMKKRENIWMPIEETSYIPGLSKQLVGAAANEEKEIEAVLPEDFPTKEHAGKKAIFKIKIKEIKERALPQIDDEFAKDLGYNNLSELKESVKKLLAEQVERQARRDMEQQAVERLLEGTDFNVPSSLVESQTKYLVGEEGERLLKQGLKKEDIKSKENELTRTLKPVAEKQIKTMFILDEIAHKENVSVSQEEIDGTLEEIAKRYGQSMQKIEQYYKDNDLMSNLRTELRNGKILDILIKEASIEQGGAK